MNLPPLPDLVIEPIVRLALSEDLGRAGDVTTDAVIDPRAQGRFSIRARHAGVVAGLDAAGLAAWFIDPDIEINIRIEDGSPIGEHESIATLGGAARSILMAERTMLNFIGRLSGIATLTKTYVDAISGTGAQIVATRKTTPGLRALEKRAVRLGGGGAHRYGLDDALLIKDNHIAAAGGIENALKRARDHLGHLTAMEVEVDNLQQFEAALPFAPTAILLDNFTLKDLRTAVQMNNKRTVLEASGGVNLQTVKAIAETGVDVISVGALTHSAPTLDVGLDAM